MASSNQIACRVCQKLNDAEKRFCVECGNPLRQVCPSCSAIVAPEERFCGNCGTRIERRELPRRDQPAAPRSEGERRQLTVLFCDLVGSTELTGVLDPEEYREIVRAYDQAASKVIERFGGHVAQYQGDGIVAYFGWPHAYGDDSERAVRAGLGILHAVHEVNREIPERHQISARVGIHTGPVVVGDLGTGSRNEITALGETPNIAARVQTFAAPSTVVITKATSRVVAGLFILEPLGPQSLKGVARPMELFHVQSVAGVRSRLQAMPVLTPFVGREHELRALNDRLELVEEGRGQVILITGEAGLGKSRLVRHFRDSLGSKAHTWLEGFCSPFGSNTPFAPITDLLTEAFRWSASESGDERFTGLENGLRAAGLKLDETVPLFAEMLNLPMPESYQPLLSSPEQKRKRLIASLAQWVTALAQLRLTVIVLEDLQWIDPSTLEVVQLLVEQCAAVPMMLICTARPEFNPPWPIQARHTLLPLVRLNQRQTLEMVKFATVGSSVVERTVDLLVERSGGVPLFIEELAHVVSDGPGGEVSDRQIPVTLADSLMARLDRLGDAKELAQVASVLGREFSYPMLREIAGVSELELQAKLKKLTEAEMIYARGITPDASYFFKHALVRDTAYDSLLKSRRRVLHRSIADTLSTKFPVQAEEQPENLAHHLTQADDTKAAIGAWQKAGDRAAARSALAESCSHYSKAIELLLIGDPSPARDQQEIKLLMALGSVTSATKGLASREAETIYTRVRELGARVKRDNSLALLGLWQTYITRGDVATALPLAEQRLKIAERENIPFKLCWAHQSVGATLFHAGRIAESQKHFQIAISNFRENDSGSNLFDMGPIAMSYFSLALALAGFADQGKRLCDTSLRTALRLAKPPTTAYCMVNAAALYQLLGDPQAVLRFTQKFDETNRLEPYVFHADAHAGWAKAASGRPSEGAEQLRTAISSYMATPQRLPHAWFLALLAWAYALAGRTELAQDTLRDASDAIGEKLLEKPIVAWARADILSRAEAPAEQVEAAWREALESARSIGMKLYELRATVGLARTFKNRGDLVPAREILSPLYGEFTEGFETADLKEAKRLLDELAS